MTGALPAALPEESRVPEFTVRKIVCADRGDPPRGRAAAPSPAPVRGAIYAICANPFAGRYEPELQPAMEDLKPLAPGR